MTRRTSPDTALGRRARQLAPVAALAGAAAAAAAATYRRRRHQVRISPERSLAGPPVQRDAPQVASLVAQLSSALEPSSDAALVPAARPTADRPPLVRRGAEDADPGAGSVGPDETAAVATAAPAPLAPALPARPSNGASNGASTSSAPIAAAAPAPIAVPAPADAAPEPVRATERPPAPVPPPAYAVPLAADPPPPPEATPLTAGTAGPSEPDGDRPARQGFAARQVAALRRHRVRLVAGLVVVALGVAASAAIAGVEEEPDSAATADSSDAESNEPAADPERDSAPGDDTGDDRASTPETSRPSETVASVDPQLDPSEVFGEAATQLVIAGSFRYQGVVRATDVSTSRPMMWLTVETAVRGEVDLATRRAHEIAEAEDGRTSETIVDGTDVWGRRADTASDAAGVPYALVPELSRPDGPDVRGLAGLPAWLSGAVGAVEIEAAPDGRRFQATVPAAVFGPVERDRQAEDVVVVVTVDDEALPRRIELATAASDHLRLAIELTAHGGTVEIVPPAPADT